MPSALPPRWRAAKPLERATSVVAPARRAALTSVLEPGEAVHWVGAPDPLATFHDTRWLWWIGLPWTAIALTLWFSGYLGEGWQIFAVAPGLAFVAAPFLLAYYASGTTYAVTDRRAIIKHDTVTKRPLMSVAFADMDEKLEILPVRPGVGHLYFASGLRTKLSDVDYTGKLAFRGIAEPAAVAEILERARTQHATR